MPDEFPTLEVVALIGVVAALLGAFQLRSALAEIPRLTGELERALRSGDLAGVHDLAARAESAAFARITTALVLALAEEPPLDATELRRTLDSARKGSVKLVQRGRGRDLVVAAVLIGAGAYAIGAELDVSLAFYALIGAALFVTALGPLLRRSTLSALEAASKRLLAPALAYREQKGLTHEHRKCSVCGNAELLELGPAALAPAPALASATLSVCRRCGNVRGRIEHPERIALDEAGGVRLQRGSLPPGSGPLASPAREHEG